MVWDFSKFEIQPPKLNLNELCFGINLLAHQYHFKISDIKTWVKHLEKTFNPNHEIFILFKPEFIRASIQKSIQNMKKLRVW